MVAIRASIIAIRLRELYAFDFIAFNQQVQIAIDRAAADQGLTFARLQIDVVRRKMTLALSHHLQNQLSLLGIPSLQLKASLLLLIGLITISILDKP